MNPKILRNSVLTLIGILSLASCNISPDDCSWAREVFSKPGIESEIALWVNENIPSGSIDVRLESIGYPKGPGHFSYESQEVIDDLSFSSRRMKVEIIVDDSSKANAVYFGKTSRSGIVYSLSGSVEYIDLYLTIEDSNGKLFLHCVPEQ